MQAKKQLLGFILALTIVPLLVSQNIDLWTQKITIENSFRDKLTFAINRVLDESQYFVNVEVELVKESGTTGIGGSSGATEGGEEPEYLAESESSTPGIPSEITKPQKTTPAPTSYSPIPGLPAIPSSESEAVEEEPSIDPQTSNENNDLSSPSFGGYQETTTSLIKSVDVTIYLEESVATAGNERDIVEIVCGIIPKTKNCEDCSDCISFKQMDFKDSNVEDDKNSALEDRLSSLEKANEEQRSQIVKMEKDKLNNMLGSLQAKLEGIETERNLLVRLDRVEDSTRLASLERKEERYQDRRDSLLLVLEQKREEALNERINAESKYAEKLFTLAEKQLEKAYNSPGTPSQQQGPNSYGGADMGLQYPNGSQSSNNWIWAIMGLVMVAGFVVMFILIKQKPQPVYLKPKTPPPPPAPVATPTITPENNGGSASENKPTTTAPPTQETKEKLEPTSTNVNQDVVKSEVKSLRQSAVTMSVGQKEAATKIIQDWLDEPEGGETEAETEEG